jgi:L-iditol 2-dehydrogenase
MAEPFAADHMISVLDADPIEEILKITNGFGADIAICANPAAETQHMAVESVRKRGKVVLFGGLPKTDPMTSLNSNTIHYKEITVMGSFSYKAEIHKKALLAIKNRQIHPEKYINLILPLDRISEGFQAALDGKCLKVLIKPQI